MHNLLKLHGQQFQRPLRRGLVLLQQLVADEQRPAFHRFRLAAGRSGWLGGIDQIRSREQDQADQGNAGLHVIALVEMIGHDISVIASATATLLAQNRIES